jgi:hypothetical protein
VRLDTLNTKKSGHSPFAAFFKKTREEVSPAEQESPAEEPKD